MKFKFTRNTLTIKQIYDDFTSGKLIIDNSYQRRKVWMPQDNIRLIETILLNLIIPEIYLWPADINPDTGETLTHIVDGQQRINAIIDFIADNFKLQNKYLINKETEFNNKKFTQLDSSLKKDIWSYELSIINIDRNCSIDDITGMFYRLNLTNYSLNEQERRNSMSSEFNDTAESLATNEFWSKNKVFSATDVRRMGDTEYCCSIIILAREGIVDQTTSRKINEVNDELRSNYFDKEANIKRIADAIEYVDYFSNKRTISFISKKSQMYTMFSLIFDFMDNNIEVTPNMIEIFELFVQTYNLYKNSMEIVFDDETEKLIYENINKYKLASSEGVNKLGNRIIRFEILKKLILSTDKNILFSLKKVIQKLSVMANDLDEEFGFDE